MADGADALSARTLSSIGDIEAAAWDALANPKDEPFDPFISHAFLLALEESKSVCREAGWAPMHLVLEEHGKAVGVAPLYLKGNSRGEYVFDQHWADAFERAGGSYYPKLLSGVPFTPVPGRRLLASSQDNRDNLARAIQQVTAQIGASSAHVNFTSPESQTALTDADYLPRLGEQFHWFNRDYETYDDFLGALSSRKRKAIKRERRDCANADVEILRLYGNEISEPHLRAPVS
ncbi:MAG: peptidogalycan biosysnthesis protein [Pseudomonadota bacterium]